MGKFIRYVLYSAGLLAGLFALLLIYDRSKDAIELQWNTMFYEPPTGGFGITIGMHEKDVVFNNGLPDGCHAPPSIKIERVCHYELMSRVIAYGSDQRVSRLSMTSAGVNVPFKNVEDMRIILGPEDILAISENFKERKYTYLEWGISFDYFQNSLSRVTFGDITYRGILGGEYWVEGRQFCPSASCPYKDQEGIVRNPKNTFEEDLRSMRVSRLREREASVDVWGEALKPEFKDKDYRYLLSLPAD